MEREQQKECDCDPDDFRVWYGITIDDIKFMKRQQWQVTYYVILLLAGIAGLYKLLHSFHELVFLWQKDLLIIVVIAIVAAGTYLLFIFQDSMQRYRKRLKYGILQNLSSSFRSANLKEITEKKKWIIPIYFFLEGRGSSWNADSYHDLCSYACDFSFYQLGPFL